MAKKVKSLNEIIKLEIYPFEIMLSFNESNESFVDTLNALSIEVEDYDLIKLNDYETKRGRTIMTPSNQAFLRLNFYPVTNSDYAMIVHELFHVTDFVLHRIGIKLSRKSDEAYAYLLQYLTEKVFNLI